MIVSNNTLLNILIPNNNNALKDVLKQADAQQLLSSSKSGTTVPDIIKNLFNDTISGSKTNETVQNMLKNSSVFKNMGNFTTQLKELQNIIKDDPKLEKFNSVIKNFLINIKNLDENILKEQVGKTGVFLESKLNDTLKTNNLPNKIQNILTQLKQELSNTNNPQAKEISTGIDKLLSSKTNTPNSLTKDLNNILSNIKNLSEIKDSPKIQNLVNQITQLKSLSSEIKLLDTKVQNNPVPQQNNEVKNIASQQENISKTTATNQTSEQKNNPINQIKELLTTLKQGLSKIDLPQAKILSQNITNILTQKEVPVQKVLDQTKTVVSKLQNFIVNQPINDNLNKMSQQTNSLKMLAYNTQPTEAKVTLEMPSSNEIKQNPTPKINQILTAIKQEISTTNSPKMQPVLQEINNLLNQKEIPIQNLINSTKNIVSQLRNILVNQPSSPTTANITQLTNALSTITQESSPSIQNQTSTPMSANQNTSNQMQTNQIAQTAQTTQSTEQIPTNEKNILSKLTETLTNIKTELLNNNLPLTKDALQIIDKLLSQSNLNLNTTTLQSNINELLTSIKSVMSNIPTQSNIQSENIYKLLNQLENSMKTNSPLMNEKSLQFNPELQKTNISNDIKSMLLQLGDELKQSNNPIYNEAYKNVDKLLTQVDYYQLMSLTSTSNYIYFPFIWDMLEEGSLSMKKVNEEKFYVEINLQLKEFGKVNMLLAMYDENHLDVSIFAQKNILKEEIQEHLQGLKKNLSGAGIVPGSIKILDLKDEEKVKKEDGFINETPQQLGFGVNIKV